MARPELAIAAVEVCVDQVLHGFFFVLKAHRRSEDFHDGLELALRRIGNLDLVRDAPQKRAVNQVFWFKVCREDDQLVEGNLYFLSTGKIQKVVSLFEWHDPSIEQLVDGHSLSTEVVDDQRSAVTLELDRRFTDSRGGILTNLQIAHSQLATDDDGWPFDLYPASIEF